MSIAVKSVTAGISTTATVTVTTSESPTATVSGDLVIVFHANDFYALANMVAPTATGSPSMNAITGTNIPLDGGSTNGSMKPWWYVANTNGAQVVSETESGSGDEEKALVAVVLSGADTTTVVDAVIGDKTNVTTGQATQNAPSVAPATTDAFLITLIMSSEGGATASYTTPGPLSEQVEFHCPSPGTSGLSGVVATEQLSASGATGTFAFTPNSTTPYMAMSLTVLTASAGSTDATVALLPVQADVTIT